MQYFPVRTLACLCLLLFLGTITYYGQEQKRSDSAMPEVPKTWDPVALGTLELPLAQPNASPVPVSPEFYYAIPVRPIYKSYPVYVPGHEPPGYLEWLKHQEPEIVWGTGASGQIRNPQLKTQEDWIKAGEMVFDASIFYDQVVTASQLQDPAWYKATGVLIAKDGTVANARYVIRQKGKVEVGNNACAFCHTRVMPDGTVIKGAQGNFPFDRSIAFTIRAQAAKAATNKDEFLAQVRHGVKSLTGTPWLQPDPNAAVDHMSIEEIAAAFDSVPPGVAVRHGTSLFFPVQVPDLIGLRDRRYFDRTGIVRHRTIADVMRYAALNNEIDFYSSFGGFVPDGTNFRQLPDPKTLGRYSDEQLYALALYAESLQPPPNPNKFDGMAAHGQKIFEQEGCTMCHTPPLYTSNKLTPAQGFAIPPEHLTKYEVLPITVGTDPNLALKTRRGTGYYKVPSLKGVWYRGPLEHNGSVATLEDWFNPSRLSDDYVPTGFRGYGAKTRAVKGHRFGLGLSAEDRKALIAFLKTL